MVKHRVLIVNKFYYPRGGDCIYSINLERLLQGYGIETAVFAMHYPENIDSKWAEYFASEIKFKGSPLNLLKAAARTLGMGDIKKTFNHILNDFKPDIVHLNNIHSYLSPILAELAQQHKAKVVWTLHDYKLLCPSYRFLDNTIPCELCLNSKWNVVKKRCMKNSLSASVIAWLEALKWNRKRLLNSVDSFICPSEFMRTKMTDGGFPKDKLVTICNFIDPVKLQLMSSVSQNVIRDNNHYCYIGRLSPEKGLEQLLETASKLPYKLSIAGDGPLMPTLKSKYDSYSNINFLGHMPADSITRLIQSCHASIIPSCWYENNPLGVIESLCAGTPVIGANIGGIPDLIDHNNGETYTWNNSEDLRKAIINTMSRKWDNNKIATVAQQRFSPSTYYDNIMTVYRHIQTTR